MTATFSELFGFSESITKFIYFTILAVSIYYVGTQKCRIPRLHDEGPKRLLDLCRLVVTLASKRELEKKCFDHSSAARKIQCDGGRPTCEKCARSQRHCQGYEVRLSWPRHDDKRRAMTGDNALPMMASPGQSRHRATDLFINTTWHEMELHGHLSGQTQTYHPFRSLPKLWTQPQQRVNHMDLVHYCKLEDLLVTCCFFCPGCQN